MKPMPEHMFLYDPVNVQRTDYANICSHYAASYAFLFFLRSGSYREEAGEEAGEAGRDYISYTIIHDMHFYLVIVLQFYVYRKKIASLLLARKKSGKNLNKILNKIVYNET